MCHSQRLGNVSGWLSESKMEHLSDRMTKRGKQRKDHAITSSELK